MGRASGDHRFLNGTVARGNADTQDMPEKRRDTSVKQSRQVLVATDAPVVGTILA